MGTALSDAQIVYRIKHRRQEDLLGFERSFIGEEIKGLAA